MALGMLNCATEHGLVTTSPVADALRKAPTPEGSVPLMDMTDLVADIVSANQCPEFPLLFGKWLVGKDTALVGFICENCDNLEESFSMTLRYSSLGTSNNPVLGSAWFSMSEHEDEVQVCVNYSVLEYEKYGSEMVIARIVSSIRHTVRDDFPFTKITFIHEQQANSEDYQKIFNCPVEFNSTTNSIVFPKKHLGDKVNARQPFAKKILNDYAETLLAREVSKDELLNQINELIIEAMPQGKLGIKYICNKLATSEASLRRKLKDKNTNYTAIVENIRKRLAKEYLKQGESVTSVTFLLGFADTSVFTRAFKRWHGIAPSEFSQSQKPF